MERRASSLEEIVSVLPPPPSASSHRRDSVTSEEDDDRRVIHRGRARSLDTTQNTATHRYMTHKGSIKTNFSIWTPDSKLFVWIQRKLIKIGRVHEDHSLFLFHKKGRFRKTVKRIVKAKSFLLFMALIVILNAIALCFYQPSINNDLKDTNSLIAYITLIATLLYIVEAGLRIIAFGLILQPKAYLRNAAHVLDVFIILFGILYASINTTPDHFYAEMFGSLMALRLLRILTMFESVRFILKALKSSVAPLFYLSIMTLCVIVFFALIGMELFLGVLHGGCYSNFTSPTGIVNMSLVSDYPCAWNTSILGNTIGSHDCPKDSTCKYWEEGPNNGMTSFDTFPQACLTVFQLITLEGWTETFYLYESAVGYTYAWVYFLSVTVLGSVFILNLWTGVLTSVFIGVSDRQEERGNIRRLKETTRINEDIKSYKDWMKKAAELELPSETGSTEKRPSLFFGRTWISPAYDNYESEDDGLDTDEEQFTDEAGEEREQRTDFWGRFKHLVQKSRRAVCVLLKSLVFFWFYLGILAINLILLMAVYYPAPDWFISLVVVVNYIFAVIYVLLTLLQLYGLGPHAFFSSFRMILAFVTAMVNVLDLLVLAHIPQVIRVVNVSMVVNACRCIGLVQIFKYTRYWKTMRQTMNTVFQLFSRILSLVAILGIFLFVFTILGLRLYAGRLSIDRNVEPNFDTWFSSFLLVFQLMTTEDWHNVMYASVDYEERLPLRYVEAFYFVLAVWMGGFVLVTIFLAIVVDKLSEVRSFEEDCAKQNAKRKEERRTRKEHINALKVDEPQVRRTTIRRAMKYLSDNPTIRARAVQEPGRKLWQQTSLPAGSVSKKRSSLFQPHSTKPPKTVRTMSVPLIDTPIRLREEPGLQSGDTGQTVHPRRQRNPLRLIRPTSGYFEMQNMRRKGGSSVIASTPPHTKSTTRENTTAVSTSQQSSAASVFVFPPSVEEAQHSATFTPASAGVVPSFKAPQKMDLSYERTQSLPAGTPSTSGSQRPFSSLGDGSQELEVIIEGTSEVEGEEKRERLQRQECLEEPPKLLSQGHQGSRHIRPPPLPSPPPAIASDDVPSRLGKESSLEVVQQPWNEDEQIERRPSQMDIAKSQLRDKARRLWVWLKEYSGTIQFNPAEELKEIPNHSAFFILSPDNRLRQLCFRVISSTVFLTITYVAIFMSSVILTLEIPIPEVNTSSLLCTIQRVVVYMDLVVIIFFLIEMALKVTALGVILHRGSYLRGFFNIVDFIVTVTSLVPILEFVNRSGGLGSPRSCLSYSYRLMSVALNILRVLRVLRPLRAIRASGLYIVVRGLLSSVKSIGGILFYDLLVITVFAVVGIQFFNGRFRYCTDPMVRTEEECHGMYFTYPSRDLTCPVVANRTWINKGLNFDNYGASFLTLYVMLTFEGWQDVMYSGINASLQPNMGPDPDTTQPEAAIYFVLYMLLMPFVLLNLFVGFVIVTFQNYGVKSFRKTKLDRNQRNCLYFALTTRPYRRYIPSYKIHRKLHNFVNHTIFKIFIFIALVLNIILLALLSHHSVTVTGEVEFFYWFNVAFTILFALEAILKIVAFTPANYFRKGWNTFEFLIALGAVVEIIIQFSLRDMLIDKYQYSHIASTFRVLRLLRMVPKMRLILWTVFKSLEIFPWVGVLWLLLVFFYSVIGVQVFGDIAIASVDEGSQIMQYNNFANFPRALLVLFRVSTGENWQDVMLDCIDGRPCHERAETNRSSCGSNFAYFFFPSFFFLTSILTLNLFVAIIIDNFDYLVRDRSKLGDHQLGLFVKLWSLYDPEAKGMLPPDKVMDLLKQCNPPVGWGKLCPHALACKKMMKLNMPLIDGQVTFNATLFALVRTSLKVPCEGCPKCAYVCNKKMLEKLKILFPRLPQKKLEEVLAGEDMHNVKKEYAAHLIQIQWRVFTLKRRKMIERFTGSGRRVLKAGLRRLPDAGPDLSTRRLSVLSLELPDAHQMPRRGSADTITSFERTGSPFNLPEMGPDECAEVEMHPVGHSKSSFIRRLQTIEELPDSTVPTEPRLEETERNLDEADLQSELSYASACSSPMASVQSLNSDGYQLQETTV